MKEADFPLKFAKVIMYHHVPWQADDDIKQLCSILFLAEYLLNSSYSSNFSFDFVEKNQSHLVEKVAWAVNNLQMSTPTIASIANELQREMIAKSYHNN